MNENKLKHLDFIENNIQKMTQCSTSLKEWLIAILVGLFALTTSTEVNCWVLFFIGTFIIISFLCLDMFYLWQERKYRILFDIVRLKKDESIDFSMSTRTEEFKNYLDKLEKGSRERMNNCYLFSFLSKSIWPFYFAMLVLDFGLFILSRWF